MGSTFYSLHYHIVFSTKERRPLIRDGWRPSLHEYLGGTVRGLSGVAEAVGGIDDHVHLLVSLNTSHVVADFVRELKRPPPRGLGTSTKLPSCGRKGTLSLR
jgi:putative transposase